MNIEKGDRVRLIIIAILAAAALLLWLAGRYKLADRHGGAGSYRAFYSDLRLLVIMHSEHHCFPISAWGKFPKDDNKTLLFYLIHLL